MIILDWMRREIVDLRRYVPPFLYRHDKENDTLLQTLIEEHETVRLGELDVQNQLSPQTAPHLEIYERMLGITPLLEDTEAVRRRRILLKYRYHISSTVAFMTALVSQYGTGSIEEHNDEYYFVADIGAEQADQLKYIKEQIELYKPAHLGYKPVLKIVLPIPIQHEALCMQYVDAHHNVWNIGTTDKLIWDGLHNWDGIPMWSGWSPDALYRDRQHHIVDITQSIEAAQNWWLRVSRWDNMHRWDGAIDWGTLATRVHYADSLQSSATSQNLLLAHSLTTNGVYGAVLTVPQKHYSSTLGSESAKQTYRPNISVLACVVIQGKSLYMPITFTTQTVGTVASVMHTTARHETQTIQSDVAKAALTIKSQQAKALQTAQSKHAVHVDGVTSHRQIAQAKQPKSIIQKPDYSGTGSITQRRSTNTARNHMDGGAVWDGIHALSGVYEPVRLADHACTCYVTNKNGVFTGGATRL